MFTRELQIEQRSGNSKSYPVSVSSEEPYLRDFGYEVLDHDPKSVDLSRAPLPLLESHDTDTLNIGAVSNLRIEHKRLRGDLTLGKSARAREVATDIEAGIVRNVSIGYRLLDRWDDGERDGRPQYRFSFQPYEVSLVSIPADPTVGVFRSHKMTDTIDEPQSRSERRRAARVGEDEQRRIDAIRSVADEYSNTAGVESAALKAISDGTTLSDFNKRALELIKTQKDKERALEYDSVNYSNAGMPCDNSTYGGGFTDKYNLINVLRALADPKEIEHIGFELEVSKQMQRDLGKQSKGILVPFDVLKTRSVTYAGTGSSIVATDHLAGSFIDVLRPRSQVLMLGATTLRGLVGDVEIPRKTAGATGSWIAGDDGDSITATDITLDQVTMAPHLIGGATTFSHRILVQGTPDIEHMVRQDLTALIGTEIDQKALQGTGASNQPQGVLTEPGVNTSTITAAGDPGWDEIIAFETEVANDNADAGNMAYLTTSAVRGAMKVKEKVASTGAFIWEAGRERGEGLVNGYRALVSNNMPTNGILFGNWSELLVGFWGGIELDADPYGTNFLKGSVTVRAIADVDIAVRHPESFCKNA